MTFSNGKCFALFKIQKCEVCIIPALHRFICFSWEGFCLFAKITHLDSFLDGLGYLHVLEMFFVKVGCGIIQKEKSFSLGETLTLPDTLYGFRSVLSGSHT